LEQVYLVMPPYLMEWSGFLNSPATKDRIPLHLTSDKPGTFNIDSGFRETIENKCRMAKGMVPIFKGRMVPVSIESSQFPLHFNSVVPVRTVARKDTPSLESYFGLEMRLTVS
ncbi:hypothetical protein HAX54_044747, partial [Datura stramonium]|nr:hypothetical protein [Datura stramonium]